MKRILKIILEFISILVSFLTVKGILDLKIIPNKYLIILIIIYVIINILILIFEILKSKILNILGIILFILIVGIYSFAHMHMNNINDFLNNAFNNSKYELNVYNVVVLNDSKYEKLSDLNNKSLGYYIYDENKEEIINNIDSNVSVKYKLYEDFDNLYLDLLDKKIESIVLSEGIISLLEENYNDIYDNIKVIYSFEISNEINYSSDVIESLEPINILISGSDSRSDKIMSKTRSDVNMIMTVDPKNKKILLTSIPRDYYVQLHGKTGLKDKLTHSGIYGIDMTKTTIEDLFDIKIDYTIKVGFKSVVQLVDSIGGIDIDSDKAFKSHCGDGGAIKTNVVKGMNHFNGGEALSYARERYAYLTGDNHRVQNQQQVLEAIIDKITSDKNLLKNYDEILSSLSEFYRTDISNEYIKLIIKNQFNDMSPWTIEKQQVSGSGAMLKTYSMPSVKLWVMEPDMNSVKKCRDKILKMHNQE